MSGRRKAPDVPPTELESETAFLVREGFVSPAPGGEYALTPDGRDWFLWAIWQSLGRPGMPTSSSSEEVTS